MEALSYCQLMERCLAAEAEVAETNAGVELTISELRDMASRSDERTAQVILIAADYLYHYVRKG